MTAAPLSPRTILAASSGNALEFYDFTVYGFMAPIIGAAFFPSDDPTTSLLSAFVVLAAGYLSRPIGSFIFGHIGDTLGRKPSLLLSVSVMGSCSILIALLPTVEQIGVVAAVLLVALRMVQGIALAGEYTVAGVLVAEAACARNRCLNTAWIPCAMMLGCVLGSGVPAFVSDLVGQEQMATWGWRVPFFFGGIVALCSVVLRSTMPETLVAAVEPPEASPIWLAFRDHWRQMLQMIAIMMPFGIVYFVIFTYASSYLTEQMHFSTAQALEISTVNLLLMAAFIPGVAWVADRVGYSAVLRATGLVTLVAAWPLWYLMHQPSIEAVFLGQMGLALLNAVGWGLSIVVLTDLVPAQVRCSTVAIGYNTAMAVFGGATPAVATYLVARTGDDFAPVYYIILAAGLSLLVLWRLPTANRSVRPRGEPS